MKQGKLIVICGTDGSGKTTQFRLLVEKMRSLAYPTETVDFPQYGEPSAYFVEKYLNGRYGGIEEVSPYTASLFYALDRYDTSFDMRKILEGGTHIIANRYASASKGHQASKFPDTREQNAFLEWLDHLEFEICGIPKPDLTIVLYVPAEMGQKLVEGKTEGREYLKDGKKKDINEANLDHLKKASVMYAQLCDRYDDWIKIDCIKDNQLMSKEEIAKLVWEKVEPILKHETIYEASR